MSINPLFEGFNSNCADAIAFDAPVPRLPAPIPVAVASPRTPCECKDRAASAPDYAARRIACCEQHGVIEIHDPRLLRPDHEAFCRDLVDAAVACYGARRAEVRMESSICRLDFDPGRFNRTELAGRVAAAVRAATPSVRDGPGDRDDGRAGRGILAAFATDGLISPRVTREAGPDFPASAERPVVATAGWRRLADLAIAGGCFALAVGGIILPGVPTLPLLIMSGHYVVRVFPGIERPDDKPALVRRGPVEADTPSGPTVTWRALWKMIGLAVLFVGACVILHPPLPLVLGLELGLMTFLGWRELERSPGRKLVQIAA